MVLISSPLPGRPLASKFSGSYNVLKVIWKTDYLVIFPDRKKAHQLCHIDMLREYLRASDANQSSSVVAVELFARSVQHCDLAGHLLE